MGKMRAKTKGPNMRNSLLHIGEILTGQAEQNVDADIVEIKTRIKEVARTGFPFGAGQFDIVAMVEIRCFKAQADRGQTGLLEALADFG